MIQSTVKSRSFFESCGARVARTDKRVTIYSSHHAVSKRPCSRMSEDDMPFDARDGAGLTHHAGCAFKQAGTEFETRCSGRPRSPDAFHGIHSDFKDQDVSPVPALELISD